MTPQRIMIVPLMTATLFLPGAALAKRIDLDDLAKVVRVADPQIAPDGKSIVIVVSRVNVEKDRYDAELVLVDVATGAQRVLTHDRPKVGHPRWSPGGDRLAFLAKAAVPAKAPAAEAASADAPGAEAVGPEETLQIFVLPMTGGEAERITSASSGVQAFSWSPDGKRLAFTRQATPHYGNSDQSTVQILDVAGGTMKPLTGRKELESFPVFSPDGTQIAFWYPRDGDLNNVNEIDVAPAPAGGVAGASAGS